MTRLNHPGGSVGVVQVASFVNRVHAANESSATASTQPRRLSSLPPLWLTRWVGSYRPRLRPVG
jgi:hypothetical protein